jgi:hypothetical protein
MNDPWSSERDALLGRRISDIGLSIAGTRVERLTAELYRELDARGIHFRPPVYLSNHGDDGASYRVAQQVLEGKHAWLETGIMTMMGEAGAREARELPTSTTATKAPLPEVRL